MGRSRSRSRERDGGRDGGRRPFREARRPADDLPPSIRDYDRESREERRDIDYRGERVERREPKEDYRGKDRDRSRSRSRDRGEKRGRDRGREDRGRERSRSRERERKRKPVQLDEFGRVVDSTRDKSNSPDRPRRNYPRVRSESPDEMEKEEMQKEKARKPDHKHAQMFQVDDDDDPETAAAKMEMEMMAKMGIPVLFETTKGKGNVQTDQNAISGGVRIKQQREARQYMNRRCGFNKPLPAESTAKKYGIGTKNADVHNVNW